MAFHFSRRKLKVREPEETGELNIVPYLDILMNLIMFMLMSITGLASLGIINVTAPSSGPAASVSQNQGPDDQKLLVSVLVSKDGFTVATNLDALAQAQTGAGGPTIPRLSDRSYDFAALTAKMVSIKDQAPSQTKVIIGAEAQVPYEVLIGTMDAVRETPDKRQLFFDVTLAAL